MKNYALILLGIFAVIFFFTGTVDPLAALTVVIVIFAWAVTEFDPD